MAPRAVLFKDSLAFALFRAGRMGRWLLFRRLLIILRRVSLLRLGRAGDGQTQQGWRSVSENAFAVHLSVLSMRERGTDM